MQAAFRKHLGTFYLYNEITLTKPFIIICNEINYSKTFTVNILYFLKLENIEFF